MGKERMFNLFLYPIYLAQCAFNNHKLDKMNQTKS